MSQQNNLVGQTLGQYEIVELIGEGGMAAVFKAWQPSLRRYVALKVLSPQLSNDAEFVKRFRQEAVSAANLKQTHIVTIHDVGTEDGYHYIAMEFIEGNSLEERIRSGQAFSLEQVIDIVAQVGAALDYAHQRGFIHRDIKPANVLIDTSGRAVLTDFGIVKAMGGSGVTSPLTQAGTIFGTPQYMSPEQVKDEPLDHRSDLYSLGIVCYEILSGQVPFDGTTTHAILYAQVNNPPPPLREFSGLDVPAQVEAVVSKMLAKEREARYGSAGAFARDLAQAVAGVWPASFGGQTAVVGGMGGSTAVIGGTPPGMQAATVRPPAGPPTPPGTAWQPSGPPTPPGTVWQPAGPSTPPGTVLQPAGPPTPVPAYAPARRSRWPWVLGGVAAVGVVLVLAAVLVTLLFPDVGNPLEWVGLGNRVERLLEDGQAALDAGNYGEAITTYEQVLEEEADNVEALREIGNAYAAQEQWQQAAEWYERWAQVAPDDVEALRGTGDAYAAQEQWQQAAGWYERWAQVAPDDVEALRGTGDAYAAQEQWSQAVEWYEKWAQVVPDDVDALKKIGQAYETQEQWQQAADWYEKWTQVVPDDGTAFLALGRARFNLGEHERAVAAYERGTELGADSADLDAHLGLAYYSLDRYDKAVEHLQDVVGQNPEDFELQRALGVSLYAQGQPDQALEHLNKAVELGADRPGDELLDVYYALGGCHFGVQDYEQAINFYKQAQELDPEGQALWAGEARANLDEAYSQLAQRVMKEVLLDLDFSNVVTEGGETYAIARTGQRAKIEGAVRLVDGPWEGSQALVIEEGTQNLCTNPSLEVNTTDWTVSGANAPTITRDTAERHRGSASLKVTTVAPGANWWDVVVYNQNNGYTFKRNTLYAISFWAKASEAIDNVMVVLKMNHDPWVAYEQSVNLTTSWQKYEVTITWDSPGDNNVRHPEFGFGLAPAGVNIWIDEVQVEEKAYATSYCDGDQGTGYSWSRVPHSSTSTRQKTVINLDDCTGLVKGGDQLTFRAIVRAPWDSNVSNSLSAWSVFDISDGTIGNRITLFYYSPNDTFYLRVTQGSGGDQDAVSAVPTFSAGDWLDLVAVVDFTNNALRLYRDGTEMASNTNMTHSVPTLSEWKVGTTLDEAVVSGFSFCEFAVFDRVLSVEEVAALYKVDVFASK